MNLMGSAFRAPLQAIGIETGAPGRALGEGREARFRFAPWPGLLLFRSSDPVDAAESTSPVDQLARELWEAHATHHQEVIPMPALHGISSVHSSRTTGDSSRAWR